MSTPHAKLRLSALGRATAPVAALGLILALSGCDYCPRPGQFAFAPAIQCRRQAYPVLNYASGDAAPPVERPGATGYGNRAGSAAVGIGVGSGGGAGQRIEPQRDPASTPIISGSSAEASPGMISAPGGMGAF